MGTQSSTDTAAVLSRYRELRDESGAWTFEIHEYQTDLNSIVPRGVPSDPNPQNAYRAAVFLEGFIQEQKRLSNWNDDALDTFDSFESTIEIEAVAKALREIATQIE